ncbi:MAG: hypothetical protein GTO22_01765 [Gemmatimonadales bacterium]|nr:hypothetical protein [Gemmatimonadales bacterium]
MRRFRLPVLAAAALTALGITGCMDTASQCACTADFRAFPLVVIDEAGLPVAEVTVTRTNLRTGRVLVPTWMGLPVPGRYIVADDGMRDEFSSEGDSLRVTGEKGDAGFVADFVFSVPDPCRCHVVRLDGVDTVTIR